MDKNLRIKQKENLCELVRQYPVIFDKSHKGCKEKYKEENAWEEIGSVLYFLSTCKSC